jgi:hypothetical protein
LDISLKFVLFLILVTMLAMDVFNDNIIADVNLLETTVLCNGRLLLGDSE